MTHEIGHSIGISHSAVRGAVMGPFIPGFDKDFQLHQDDIDAVQAIYGKYIIQNISNVKQLMNNIFNFSNVGYIKIICLISPQVNCH